MDTWHEVSRDSFLAAKFLLQQSRLRSSVSRAYYAAYAAVTHEMVEQAVTFPSGWQNPTHEQLPRWLRRGKKWPDRDRRKLVTAIRGLRKAREDADYRPGRSLTRSEVIRLLKQASLILQALEVGI